MKRISVFAVFLIVTLSCQLLNTGNNQDPVIEVSENDVDMNAAIEEAQRTLYFFIENFQSPKPEQTYFGIKAHFKYGVDGIEHMWISDLSYQDEQFVGILGSEPVYVQGIELGDRVTVPVAEISDWMIIENGRLIGGYTIKALRNQMSLGEREKFDRSLGLVIEYPSTPIPTKIP